MEVLIHMQPMSSLGLKASGKHQIFFPFDFHLNDDLSAFGSSIVFSWTDYHSGTGLRGWLSLMRNLSYLILYCLIKYRILFELASSI